MTASHDWRLWTCDCRIVVAEPQRLAGAVAIADDVLADVERAASRFRPDSEVLGLAAGWNDLSPMLADLVREALVAAWLSDGAVDPTVGATLAGLGYDRTFADLPEDGRRRLTLVPPVPGWRSLRLDGARLYRPRGVQLDLGATAKAVAADRTAAAVADELGTGVMVSLGGDIATSGPAPDGGWQVTVQDLPTDVPQQMTLHAGAAIATSSTAKRTWTRDGRHAAPPGRPGDRVARGRAVAVVTVVAPTALRANTASTGAIVKGGDAVALGAGHRVPRPVHRPRGTRPVVTVSAGGRGRGPRMNEALWALGRGTGVVALVMFTTTLVLGIAGRSGRLGRGPRPVRRHRGAPHCRPDRDHPGRGARRPLSSSTPTPSCGWSTWCFPFLGSYRPLWLGLGTLAVDLLVVVGGQPAPREGRAPCLPGRPLGDVRTLAGRDGARGRHRHRPGSTGCWTLAAACGVAVARVRSAGGCSPSYAERGWSRTPRRVARHDRVCYRPHGTQRLLGGPGPRAGAAAHRRGAGRPASRASGLTGRGGAGFPTAAEDRALIGRGPVRRRQRHGGRAPQPQGRTAAARGAGAGRRRAGDPRRPRSGRGGPCSLSDTGSTPDRSASRSPSGRPPSRSGTWTAGSWPARSPRSSTSSTAAPRSPRDPLVPVCHRGVDGRPTLVVNAETLAQLALLARYGADWFRSARHARRPRHVPGLPDRLDPRGGDPPGRGRGPARHAARAVLASAGTTLPRARAVLVGGYHGAWVPMAALDAPLSREGLAPYGATPGCRRPPRARPRACPLRTSADVASYLAGESAATVRAVRQRAATDGGHAARLAVPGADRALAAEVDRLRGLVADGAPAPTRTAPRTSWPAPCGCSPGTSSRTCAASATPSGAPHEPRGTRLHVDWTRCDGHGSCAELLPELLTVDEWGFPVSRSGERGTRSSPRRWRPTPAAPRRPARCWPCGSSD